MHEGPDREGQRHIDQPRPNPLVLEPGIQSEQGHSGEEWCEVEIFGVKNRNHGDGPEVIHHRQREQESAQCHGQISADDGQDRKCESDIGSHRDPPPDRRTVAAGEVHRHEEQRRDDHASERGGHRHGSFAARGQAAEHKFMFEFQPGDEEEHREQSIRGPGPQAEVEFERSWTHHDFGEFGIGIPPRTVGEDHGRHRGHEQQHPADSFVAQRAQHPQPFGKRWPFE